MPSQNDRQWMKRSPAWLLKLILYFYPPYLGTGFHLKTISPDFRFIEVTLKLHWYNKNIVGTHFGGSIFSMSDPFYVVMLLKNLGEDYIVWDKAAYIEFKKPGRGTLRAIFTLSEEEIQDIRLQADTQGKYVFDRTVNILDKENVVVATVVKTLFVAKKKPH